MLQLTPRSEMGQWDEGQGAAPAQVTEDRGQLPALLSTSSEVALPSGMQW